MTTVVVYIMIPLICVALRATAVVTSKFLRSLHNNGRITSNLSHLQTSYCTTTIKYRHLFLKPWFDRGCISFFNLSFEFGIILFNFESICSGTCVRIRNNIDSNQCYLVWTPTILISIFSLLLSQSMCVLTLFELSTEFKTQNLHLQQLFTFRKTKKWWYGLWRVDIEPPPQRL